MLLLCIILWLLALFCDDDVSDSSWLMQQPAVSGVMIA
jgi:hypothetical protein